ncbi:MAG: pseudouridine synthase [Oscillospiraceae bacterium]
MDILYQDDRIVVAVKPVGVLSTDEPGGMPELLRAQLHTDCIRTVHRLDAQVSGVMVFARSRMAASLLSQRDTGAPLYQGVSGCPVRHAVPALRHPDGPAGP